MFRRSTTTPPARADATRAARRPGRWRRHMAMVLPGALVPSMLILIGYVFWYHQGSPGPAVVASAPPAPAAAPAPPRRTSLPQVIYGGEAPGTAAQPSDALFAIRATVVDGDTLAAGGERLRLNGIDAPEMAQICERDGGAYRCGEQARAAMGRIVGDGTLNCAAIGVDRYDRRVVRCVNRDGQDISAALVAEGWALAYRQYASDYIPQEDEARTRGRGIWAGRFDAPWDWRRRQGY